MRAACTPSPAVRTFGSASLHQADADALSV
jgi:hypothetical protein